MSKGRGFSQSGGGVSVPAGGTTGQVLAKTSNTDFAIDWQDAGGTSHTHSNKAVLDNVTQPVIDNSHTHGNKVVLDGTTASFTTALKTAYDAANAYSTIGHIPIAQKGAASGVAELDSAGKVLVSQLPSYVSDVLEYATKAAFPATGSSGKIYIAVDENKSYRWTGTVYTAVGDSVALGETSATAYRGDRGKVAYDHAQTTGNPHNTAAGSVSFTPPSGMTSTNVNAAISELNTSKLASSEVSATPTANKVPRLDANGKLPFSAVGSTPTTLAGYGVTDAYTKTEANTLYAPTGFGLGTIAATVQGTDINNVKVCGFYYVVNAVANSSLPTTQNGYLLVQGIDTNYVNQIYSTYGSNEEFVRWCVNGTWGGWWKRPASANPSFTGVITGTQSGTFTPSGGSLGMRLFSASSANNDVLCFGWIREDSWAILAGDNTTWRSLCLQPFGGTVGIGTTSAAYTLDVLSPAATATQLFRFGINGVTNGFSAVVDSTNSIKYYFQSGRVAVGVIDPKTTIHGSGNTIIGADTVNAADIGNGQLSIQVNETNNTLVFTYRRKDGTLKSGALQLS